MLTNFNLTINYLPVIEIICSLNQLSGGAGGKQNSRGNAVLKFETCHFRHPTKA